MKKKGFDFDKDFERFLAEWYAEHIKGNEGCGHDHEGCGCGHDHDHDGCGHDHDETEEELLAHAPDVYAAWALTPNDALGGVSPKGYFDAVTDPKKLLELFIENPCSLLYDRIADTKSCADGLVAVIGGAYGADHKIDAAHLLNEMGVKPPVALYARLASDAATPAELADLLAERIAEYADEAQADLYGYIGDAPEPVKARIAEILLSAPPDERTYQILTDLLNSGSDTALYAGYLGKYGDPRAAELLYKKLDPENRAEYMEIRNAIERLGGIVD